MSSPSNVQPNHAAIPDFHCWVESCRKPRAAVARDVFADGVRASGGFMGAGSNSVLGDIPSPRRVDGGGNEDGGDEINGAAPCDGVTHILDLGSLGAVLGNPSDEQRSQCASAPTNGVHKACHGSASSWFHGVEKRCEN